MYMIWDGPGSLETEYFNFLCFYPVSCFNILHNTMYFYMVFIVCFILFHFLFLHVHVSHWIQSVSQSSKKGQDILQKCH